MHVYTEAVNGAHESGPNTKEKEMDSSSKIKNLVSNFNLNGKPDHCVRRGLWFI